MKLDRTKLMLIVLIVSVSVVLVLQIRTISVLASVKPTFSKEGMTELDRPVATLTGVLQVQNFVMIGFCILLLLVFTRALVRLIRIRAEAREKRQTAADDLR